MRILSDSMPIKSQCRMNFYACAHLLLGFLCENRGVDIEDRDVTLVRRFMDCEAGVSAIEYAILAATMSVVIIGASGSIRSAIAELFGNISNAVVSAK
jgi:Flp pilus assembly pilin Flp